MKKKYKLGKIVSKRSYITEELADLLGVHVQTVRQWRKEGLSPIEPNASPYLFFGMDVKRFLIDQRAKYKPKLQEGEFYCLKCKKGVRPKSVQQVCRNVFVGNGKVSYLLVANCPMCGIGVRRFTTLLLVQVPNTATMTINEVIQMPIIKKEQLSLFDLIEESKTALGAVEKPTEGEGIIKA